MIEFQNLKLALGMLETSLSST